MNGGRIKKIHSETVKPITNKNFDSKKVLGGAWLPEVYCNVGLIARKKSGKSTVIYRCLEKCLSKDCKVYIFCSTVHIDSTYKKMRKMLKKKGCDVESYEHFIDPDSGNHHLARIMKEIGNPEGVQRDPRKPEPELDIYQYMFEPQPDPDNPVRKKESKKQQKKKISPEVCFIFDDLGNSMRDKYVTLLLQRNRHLKAKVFMAMHSLNNLMPAGLQMLDNVLFFPNLSKEKIMEFQGKLGLHFKNDTKKDSIMCKLYDDATKQKYNFLHYDHSNVQFRKNFNKLYIIDE